MIGKEQQAALNIGNSDTAASGYVHTTKSCFLFLTFASAYIGFNYVMPLLVRFMGGALVGQLGRVLSASLLLFLIKDSLKERFLSRYIAFTVGAIMVWAVAASVGTLGRQSEDVLSPLYNLLTTLVIYVVFVYVTEYYDRSSRIVLIALALFAFMNISVALYSAATGHSLYVSKAAAQSIGIDAETGRITGFRGENYVGLWTAPLLAFALFSFFYPRYRILVVTIPLILAAVVISLSRTSVVCSGIVIVMSALILYRAKSRVWLIVMILILAPPTVWVGSKALLKQTKLVNQWTLQREMGRMTQDNRTATWSYWLSVANEHVLGIGPGGIQSTKMGASGMIPHNSLLDVLVEYGIFGFLLYCVPWWFALRSTIWVLKKNNYDFDLAVFVATFWGMFLSLQLLSNAFMKIVFIVAGCIEGRRKFLRRNAVKVETIE